MPMDVVARVDQLQGDGPYAASARGVDIVLLRTSSGWRAYEGRCPHQAALLGEGELIGTELVCRNHRWRFDAQTGRRNGGAACLRACELREESGQIMVDVSPLAAAAAKGARRTLDDLPAPRGFPVVGNLPQLDPDRRHEALERWARKYGPVYRLRLGPKRVVVISDSSMQAEILSARPETFRRISSMERAFREVGAYGLIAAEGKDWRPLRRLSMEALAQKNLHGFYPTLKLVAERLHRRWSAAAHEGKTLDLVAELKRFLADVTTLLVFGHDVNTLEEREDSIHRHLELIPQAVHRRLIAPFPYWRYIKLPADRRVERGLVVLRRWLSGIADEARARLAANPALAEQPKNFLEAMLTARDDDGRPFSDDVLLGNSIEILIAGKDTTAQMLAWAVHHLCDRPKAVAALRSELSQVLGRALLPADLETANRLAQAAAIANETMRFRPSLPALYLESCVDAVVGDLAIPRGTVVFLLNRPAMSDARNFEAPDEFRPERWIQPTGPHETGVHIPFGSGPRICPGRNLAMLEMRVVLATLYQSFDVERVGQRRDVKERYSFSLAPENLAVRLRPRRRVVEHDGESLRELAG